MVTAVVPLGKDKTSTYGWLQFEKKALGELHKLALKSPTAMSTLMYLIKHMSRSNAIVISQQAIAKGIGTSRQSVNQAVRYLHEHNFIETVKAGGATVYVINSRVAWQGERGARFAAFGADIVALEEEQSGADIDNKTPLKQVPQLVEGERLHVGNEPIDPPDQGELNLP